MAPKGVSSQKPEFAADDSIGQKISDAFLGTLILVARYISMEWKKQRESGITERSLRCLLGNGLTITQY